MRKYEYEDDVYIDGEDNKPKLLSILGILTLIIIIVIIIAACVGKRKEENTNLSYIRVSEGVISPMFNANTTNYEVSVEKEELTIFCATESKKSTVSGCNAKVLLTEKNKEHSIKVTAENGTTKVYKILINKFEEQKEKLSVKIISANESGKELNESVELNTELSQNSTEIIYEWYKDNKKMDSTESKIIAKESGNYYVKVTNKKTKEEAVSEVFVVNIKSKSEKQPTKTETNKKDNYTLSISKVSGNSSKWTSSVTLYVEASTSNGLDSKAYSFDGGKTYQASNFKKFTKNQTVKIVVKDIKGNIASKNVKITKIDNTIPEVTISATNKTNKSVTLKAIISPITTASGYTYEWYKNGNKINGETKNTYKATESGKYKVKVITGTNKSAVSKEYNFTVVNISCPVITATASNGDYVSPKTWFNEVIYIKIGISDEIKKYDVYLNEYGIFNEISSNFTYTGTFTQTVKIKVVNNGLRMLKMKVYDKNGNSETCYSNVYYLK